MADVAHGWRVVFLVVCVEWDWFLSHGRTNQKTPNKKKVVNTTLCTTWGCINTLNYPGFLGRVREFPCREVRFPSWKYDIGRIFKMTWTKYDAVLKGVGLPIARRDCLTLVWRAIFDIRCSCQLVNSNTSRPNSARNIEFGDNLANFDRGQKYRIWQ